MKKKNRYRKRNAEPTLDWFMSRVRRLRSGCWELLSVDGKPMQKRPGGPMLKICGRQINAKRWLFEQEKGSLGGLFVCHTCDNGWCVNPDHLFKGTARDNVHDCMLKGRRYVFTPEEMSRRARVRVAPWNKGLPMAESTKQKLSKKLRGQKRALEFCEKMFLAAKQREKRFKKLGMQRKINKLGQFTGEWL